MGKIIIKSDVGNELTISNNILIDGATKKIDFEDFKYIRNTVTEMLDLNDMLVDGDVVFLKGYHSVNDGGSGTFVYSATGDKSTHNGGTVIDPLKAFPSDWNNEDLKADWFNGNNSGTGVLERVIKANLYPEIFGAKGDGVTDDSISIQQLFNDAAEKYGIKFLSNKKYYAGNIEIKNKNYIDFNYSVFKIKPDTKLFYNLTDNIEISIKNLYIDGNGANFTPTTTSYNGLYPIYLRYPINSKFENIKITNSAMIAICIGDPSKDGAQAPRLANCNFDNIDIETTGLSYPDDDSDNKGIKIVSQKNITVTNSRISGCRGQAIHTVNSENIFVSKVVTENNTNGGIWFSYGTTGSIIDDCVSIDDGNAVFGLNPGHYTRDVDNGKPNQLLNSYCETDAQGVAAMFGNSIIVNNTIKSSNNGIVCNFLSADQNKNMPELFKVINNKIECTDTVHFAYGIYLDNTILTTHLTNYENVYIENNKIYNYQNRGIKINTYNDIPTKNIIIKGNYVKDTGQNAISLSNVNDVYIENNIGSISVADKYLLAVNNCDIDLLRSNKINTGNLFGDNGGNTITNVDEFYMPFYQTGSFTATGDGSATTLTFDIADMKVVPKLLSVYQTDDDINGWRVSGVANNSFSIEFANAPADGKVKSFFAELKLNSYSS